MATSIVPKDATTTDRLTPIGIVRLPQIPAKKVDIPAKSNAVWGTSWLSASNQMPRKPIEIEEPVVMSPYYASSLLKLATSVGVLTTLLIILIKAKN